MSEDLPGDIPEDILKVREGPGSVCPGLQSLNKFSFQGSSRNRSPRCWQFSVLRQDQARWRPLEGNLEIGETYLIVEFLEVAWPEVLIIAED